MENLLQSSCWIMSEVSIISGWIVILKNTHMKGSKINCLLGRIRNNQFTDSDLVMIEQLTNKTKYQKKILKLMYGQLNDEFHVLKLNLNEFLINKY